MLALQYVLTYIDFTVHNTLFLNRKDLQGLNPTVMYTNSVF